MDVDLINVDVNSVALIYAESYRCSEQQPTQIC